MKCPACKNLAIVVEHESIEVDYCTHCSGVWFDAGEFQLLLETMQLEGTHITIDSILKMTEAVSEEKKRRCPICAHKMKKTKIGHHPEVIIDVGPNEDGIWFDGGEVGQMVEQLTKSLPADTDSEDRVITFLGETFRANG